MPSPLCYFNHSSRSLKCIFTFQILIRMYSIKCLLHVQYHERTTISTQVEKSRKPLESREEYLKTYSLENSRIWDYKKTSAKKNSQIRVLFKMLELIASVLGLKLKWPPLCKVIYSHNFYLHHRALLV